MAEIPQAEQLDELFNSDFFKVLSEPVRVQILRHLAVNGKSSIGEIAEDFPQDRSVISRHLKQMAEEGMVTIEKRGRFTFYFINGRNILAKLDGMADFLRRYLREFCPEGVDL
jgi:ArsR family transcriptional regulator, cadmium/lead-responsive transcriptional repressor